MGNDVSTVATDAPMAVSDAPTAVPSDTVEYVYAETPDGRLIAVPRSEVRKVTETERQDKPEATEPEPEAQFYVHLCNGDVKRVAKADLPAPGGTNSPLGHWRTGNSVYDVIGIYPVESVVKE